MTSKRPISARRTPALQVMCPRALIGALTLRGHDITLLLAPG